ncbi:MAG TPA: hypothetical protein VK446_09140 [Methylocystis sp.]|nr:hypothetical protein [Methylocystis sp.]
MDEPTSEIAKAAGLGPAIAKAAIRHVLLFLDSKAPEGRVGEYIDKTPEAAKRWPQPQRRGTAASRRRSKG